MAAMPQPSYPVLALLAAKARFYPAFNEPSAIAKQPLQGRVTITREGILGDEQADRRYHGGPDKALHHYAFDHHASWAQSWGEALPLGQPGGFGENIATTGLVEEQVLLGDRFRLGTALIEVSHGRQPCFKLNHRFNRASVVAEIVKTGRCGWYYRVIEEGHCEVGAGVDLRLEQVAEGLAQWPVARLFRVLVGGGHKADSAALAELAALPQLAEAWRTRARELQG